MDLAATTIDATYSMTFDFAGETFTMDGDVAMDLQASVGEMTIRMQGVPNVPADAQLRVVIDGDDTYFHDPELYGTSDWIRVSSDEAGVGDQVGTGPDLSAFLGYLNGAQDVERIGTENIAGASSTHYKGDVDLEQAFAHTHTQANDAEDATEHLTGQLGEIDVSFDVWIDDAGTMRRMAFAFDPQEGRRQLPSPCGCQEGRRQARCPGAHRARGRRSPGSRTRSVTHEPVASEARDGGQSGSSPP